MKNILFFIFIFFALNANSQNLYLGYPVNTNLLDSGDIIILEPIPWLEGKVDTQYYNYFEFLKLFMLNNSKFKFEIYLNYKVNNPNICKFITDQQKERMKEILDYDPFFKDLIDYEIFSCGNNDFLIAFDYIKDIKENKRKKILSDLNSRVEIHLKSKDN